MTDGRWFSLSMIFGDMLAEKIPPEVVGRVSPDAVEVVAVVLDVCDFY